MKAIRNTRFGILYCEVKPLIISNGVCVILHEKGICVRRVYVSKSMHEVSSFEVWVEYKVSVCFWFFLEWDRSEKVVDSLMSLWCHELPLIFPQNWVALRLILIECMRQFDLIISIRGKLLVKILIFSYFFLLSFVVSLGGNRLYTSLYALLMKYYS